MAAYEPDRIFVSCNRVKALADTGVTPFYLYDAPGICQSAQHLRQQFQWCPGFQNYFPMRENANPSILQLIQESGLGVLACCKAELLLAERCGFHGNGLLYEPVRRDYDADLLASQLDAAWLLNSPSLTPCIPVDRVILRVHPQQILGRTKRPGRGDRSKNGFSSAQMLETIRLLKARGASKIGLALNGTGAVLQPGLLAARAAALFRLLPEIREKTGVTVHACCLGGGLGPAYRPSAGTPKLSEEAALVQRQYEALPPELRPRLLTTLSKPLLESHGLLITKILEVREHSHSCLIVDASVCQFLRPALKQAYRHISILGKNDTENRRPYQVSGYLPEEFDRFGESRMLPSTEAGDYCVIHDVGCGGRSMPMLYAMQPPCAEYLAYADGQLRRISAPWTQEQVLALLTAQEPKN